LPPEIIGHVIWLYHRFCLSFRDVEDLLAERGVEPWRIKRTHVDCFGNNWPSSTLILLILYFPSVLAENCLLAQIIEGLLWRKPTLKLCEAAAIYDLKEILINPCRGAFRYKTMTVC